MLAGRDRHQQQREADAEQAMQPRGQEHLDEEAGDRRIEDHVGEERRPRVLAGDRILDRHVELLLDDARADRREADDERDDLEVLRLPQQG